jgi:hypothetical protein
MLTFKEVSESGRPVSKPKSFDVRVDLETWQECDPPERSAIVAGWVQEFLDDCPEEQKAEFSAEYERVKRTARRLAEYTIEPADVVEGKLISYSDIISKHGALSHGGRGFTYRFEHHGREYLVEDLYCPNPDCHCEDVHLEFWEAKPGTDGNKTSASIRGLFIAKVTFGGCVELIENSKCKADEASRVLSAWWEEHHDDLEMLKGRYQDVKKIGQRCLDTEGVPPRRFDTLVDQPLGDEMLYDEPLTENIKVGRNDPCPCGSGKKFKKCCYKKGTYEEHGGASSVSR